MSYQQEIQTLYVAYFSRPADPAGLAYWENVVRARQGSTAGAAAAFAASDEYRASFDSMDADAIVTAVYQNLFSRVPEGDGLAYWAGLLRTGQLSVDAIVRKVADGALGSDKAALGNKVEAALALTAQLDTPREAAAYARPDAAHVAKQFIYSITTDASLAAALAPAAMAQTLHAIATATPQRVLSAGNDYLLASDANDSVFAPVLNGVNTFQTGDSLHGGAGDADVLTAELAAGADYLVNARSTGFEIVSLQTSAAPIAVLRPLAPQTGSLVEAGHMSGVRRWESNSSSDDLFIRNVTPLPDQARQDLAVVMRDTAPGDVDLSVTFSDRALLGAGKQGITASVVLDNVGRGGTSGGLLVDASRYDIEVRDSSKLQLIDNGHAEEIVLRNGITARHDAGDPGRVRNEGDLAVMGETGANLDILTMSGSLHVRGFGFSEVRVLDASAMLGKFSFKAAVTDHAIAKYLDRGELGAPLPDKRIDFVYSGGADDDRMQIDVSGNVLASHLNSAAAHGDFAFKVDGGGGNDIIKFNVNDGKAGWKALQHDFANLDIRAGDGNDTVILGGASDAVLDPGTGNDRVTLAGGGETLLFAPSFGNDVVLNFGDGADRLDFSALGGKGSAFHGTAIASVDQAITVRLQTDTSDSEAEIALLYPDTPYASTHVFVAVDAANVGKVYAVADSAAGGVTATLVGSIDLSATPWTGLTGASFV